MDFWSRVDKSGECWIWTGELRDGYGVFKEHGKRVRAHRRAYALAVGSIPDGLVIRHRCDNPACCRPEHLLLGTQLQNIADRQERSRQARGESNARARLTASKVVAIRVLCEDFELPHALVGDLYDVHADHITNIVNRKKWKHVT